MVAEGTDGIGTQWVEVDKTEKVRVETKQAGGAEHVLMKLKSRLVAMGNHERREVCSESPTANTEGLHRVFSFARSREDEGAVLTYFTGLRMSRVFLLRRRRSGLPGLNPRRPLAACARAEHRMQGEGSGRSSAAHCLAEVSQNIEFCNHCTL